MAFHLLTASIRELINNIGDTETEGVKESKNSSGQMGVDKDIVKMRNSAKLGRYAFESFDNENILHTLVDPFREHVMKKLTMEKKQP